MSTETILTIVGILVSLLTAGAIVKIKSKSYKITQNNNIANGDIVGRDKK